MNSDGTNIRQLTNDPSDESQPRWSPVGVATVGSLETVISEDPWFGTPQCQRDTDGDGYPDIPATNFPTSDSTVFVVFLFGNMQDGTGWGWSAPGPVPIRNFVATGHWQDGPAGRYIYSIPMKPLRQLVPPADFSVSFTLAGKQHAVTCKLVRP